MEVTIVSFVVSNLSNKFGFKREKSLLPNPQKKKSFLRVKKKDKAATVVSSVTWKSTWNRLDEFKGGKETFHKTTRKATRGFFFPSSLFLLSPLLSPPFFFFFFSDFYRFGVIRCQTSPTISLVPLIKLGNDGKEREKKTSKEKLCLDSRSIWNFQNS